jgi:hypothetical protein
MGIPPPDPPDLLGVITAANDAALPYVIIGGYAVIAHQFVRGTEDVDLLIAADRSLDPTLMSFLEDIDADRDGEPITLTVLHRAERLSVSSRCGPVVLLREGAPPLDFDTVARQAIHLDYHGQHALVASLGSLAAFKRLADRPRDRLDLVELERIHGPLPEAALPPDAG